MCSTEQKSLAAIGPTLKQVGLSLMINESEAQVVDDSEQNLAPKKIYFE